MYIESQVIDTNTVEHGILQKLVLQNQRQIALIPMLLAKPTILQGKNVFRYG